MDIGYGTCAAIVRRVDTGVGDTDIFSWDGVGGPLASPLRWNANTGIVSWHNGFQESLAPTIKLQTTDEWTLLVATKDTGTVLPRFHKYTYATRLWTHENGSVAIADNGAGPTAVVLGRNRASFPATPIRAQFTGIADAQTLTAFDAANWGNMTGLARPAVGTTANSIRGTGLDCHSYWLTDLGSADNEVYWTIAKLATSGSFEYGVNARIANPTSGSTRTGYIAGWVPGTNVLNIYRITAGVSYAKLASAVTASPAVGDAQLFRVTGGTPTTLEFWIRYSGIWGLALSYSDATPNLAGNFIGFETGQSDIWFDDFGGGAVSSSASNKRDIAAAAWYNHPFHDIAVENMVDPAFWRLYAPSWMGILDREKLVDSARWNNESSRSGTSLVTVVPASNIYLPSTHIALRSRARSFIASVTAPSRDGAMTISGGGSFLAVTVRNGQVAVSISGNGTQVATGYKGGQAAAVISGGGSFSTSAFKTIGPLSLVPETADQTLTLMTETADQTTHPSAENSTTLTLTPA